MANGGLRAVAVALTTVAMIGGTDDLHAEIITFETIAVTGDAMPGSGGVVYERFSAPIISGGTVVFEGNDRVSVSGLYASSGGTITRLADTSTAIPDGTGNFTGFNGYSVSNGTVYYRGVGTGDQAGAYSIPVSGGTSVRIADMTTPVPDGRPMDDFEALSTGANGGVVAIEARIWPDEDGIYTFDGGTFTTIVNPQTQMPGTTSNFGLVSSPDVAADGTVVFQGANGPGSSPHRGIYTGNGGALTTIADTNTVMPNSTGMFDNLRTPSISDSGTVAFSAAGTEIVSSTGAIFSGVYTSTDGILSVIADATTLTPDGTPFGTFSPVITPIWEDVVAFVGFDLMAPELAREALYLSRAGTIYRLLTISTVDLTPEGTGFVGEIFDGRQLVGILLGQDALEGDTLAFTANFADGSSGVYTANIDVGVAAVPEPSSLALLALTGVAFAGVNWQRRHKSTSRTTPIANKARHN